MIHHKLHHFFRIVVLCMAVLFVSGIAIPNFFSKQYFEQSEHDLQLNATQPSNFSAEFSNGSLSTSYLTYKPHLSLPPKTAQVTKRRKRNVLPQSDKKYTWHFNINVTRRDNITDSVPSKENHDKSLKSKGYLGLAVYVEGSGPKETYQELERSLSSAEAFIKNVFGSENGGSLPHADQIISAKGSVDEDPNNENMSSEGDITMGEKSESSSSKPRGGRFILDFLGFGGRSSTTTREPTTKSELDVTQLTSESNTEQTSVFRFGSEQSITVPSHEIDQATVNLISLGATETSKDVVENASLDVKRALVTELIEKKNLSSESLKQSESDTDFEEMEKISTVENVESISERERSGIEDGCNDCLEYPESMLTELNENTDEESIVFSDSALEKFCMDLVNRLEDSQRLFTETNSEDLLNSTQDSNAQEKVSDLLLSPEEKSNFGPDLIEDSYFLNGDSTVETNTNPKDETRESRFLGLNIFGFGSGRSALGNWDDDVQDQVTTVENLPSIRDCENYFRKKQVNKMFAKPNLMDMISDPNIKLTDFANATISPELQELNLQFLTDLLHGLGHSTDKSDVVSENVNQNRPSTEGSDAEEFSQSTVSDVRPGFTSLASSSLPNTADALRDGRFIGIFNGFGSGSDETVVPVDDDGRFFLGSFLGSGDGRSGNDVFQDDFSGNQVDFNESQGDEGRIFSLLNLGSGDGRQLTEDDTQSNISELEDWHEEDCSTGTESLSHDVTIEDSLDHTYVTESDQHSHQYSESGSENSASVGELSDVEENQSSLENRETSKMPMDAKFLSFFEDGGSGNGRNLQSGEDSTQSEIDLSNYNLENDYSDETHSLDSCNDCEDIGDLQSHSSSNQAECLGCSDEYYLDHTENHEGTLTPKPEYEEGHPMLHYTTDYIHEYEFEKSVDDPTEKSVRIFGTVFLTGSGDGGLIEDGGGPINLIEEDTIKPPGLPFRRSRKLDLPEETFESLDSLYKFSTEHVFHSTKVTDSVIPIVFSEDRTSVQFPRRTGRLDDSPVQENIGNENSLAKDVITNVETSNTLTSFQEKSSSIAVTTSYVPSSSVSGTSSIFKTEGPEPVFCNSASECNYHLNERCVRKGPSLVCDCLEPLVRQKDTGKCVAKVSMDVLLRFPLEEFDEDLSNPESQRFKQRKDDVFATMNLILEHAYELMPLITDVKVIGFSRGSLIVNINIVFASENKSESDLVKTVKKDLNLALQQESVIQRSPLNARDASMLSVSTALDPCSSSELNYCSKNSLCIRNATFPGGFSCSCKKDYIDASSYMLPGEVCEILCPENFCGVNGECHLISEGRKCLCRGWYFGDRCEISGVVVIAAFSASLVSIILVTILVIVCRGRCRSSQVFGRQYAFQRSEEVWNDVAALERVTEVIAMEENMGVRVAKFQDISALNLPVIKITHPILSSSTSFEWDSTFNSEPGDRTTSKSSLQKEFLQVEQDGTPSNHDISNIYEEVARTT